MTSSFDPFSAIYDTPNRDRAVQFRGRRPHRQGPENHRFGSRRVGQAARLLLTPELSICGYAAEDLFLRPAFVEGCEDAVRSAHHRQRE
jgi:hypothetical protein